MWHRKSAMLMKVDYSRRVPIRNYISKLENTLPGFKTVEDRLMLSLGGNAFGGHKFNLYLVCHSENSLSLKSIIQG
jgi:hypothetical protein